MSNRSWTCICLAFGFGALACSSSGAAARDPSKAEKITTFAVMPANWVNEQPQMRVPFERTLAGELAKSRGIRVVDPERTRAKLGDAEAAANCAEEPSCARQVGRSLGADKVVTLRLAELGDTLLVRLTLLDVRAGTQEQAHQRIVQGARARDVDTAVRGLARDAARPFTTLAPEPRPAPKWYERWYTWAGGAAAVVIGAGAVILSTSGGNEGGNKPSPDVTVRAP